MPLLIDEGGIAIIPRSVSVSGESGLKSCCGIPASGPVSAKDPVTSGGIMTWDVAPQGSSWNPCANHSPALPNMKGRFALGDSMPPMAIKMDAITGIIPVKKIEIERRTESGKKSCGEMKLMIRRYTGRQKHF